MKIMTKMVGPYQENSYIVSLNGKELIIDPGQSSFDWISKNVKNPVAILNTHGHSDHIWSNKILKDKFNIPIYCPKGDCFMLMNDFEKEGYDLCTPDFEVKENETLEISELKVKFLHFPGHTPGSSAIKIGNALFTGDFIFKGSIGRTDFSFSSPKEMKKSINNFLKMKENLTIYPGHGPSTTVKNEQRTIAMFLKFL